MARSTLIVVAAQLCAQRFVFEPGLGVRARGTDRDPEAFGERQEVRQADPVLAAAGDLNRAELAGADPVADRSFCVTERFGDLTDAGAATPEAIQQLAAPYGITYDLPLIPQLEARHGVSAGGAWWSE